MSKAAMLTLSLMVFFFGSISISIAQEEWLAQTVFEGNLPLADAILVQGDEICGNPKLIHILDDLMLLNSETSLLEHEWLVECVAYNNKKKYKCHQERPSAAVVCEEEVAIKEKN